MVGSGCHNTTGVSGLREQAIRPPALGDVGELCRCAQRGVEVVSVDGDINQSSEPEPRNARFCPGRGPLSSLRPTGRLRSRLAHLARGVPACSGGELRTMAVLGQARRDEKWSG